MLERIKDMFKTSGGKYISPQKIELLLGQENLIEQIITIGDNRRFVSALIVPSFEHLKPHARKLGLDPDDHQLLVKNEGVIRLLQDKIDKLQEELTPYERVVRFTLLPEPFTIENSAMTSTLKLRRKIIGERFKEQIEQMYSAG